MTTTTLTAGGTSPDSAFLGGNDGTLLIQTGPSNGKVNALSIAADGTPTFLKALTVPSVNGVTGLTVTSPQVTPLPSPSTVITVSHGLSAAPVDATLELVCITAEYGYSVGDVIQSAQLSNGTFYTPAVVWKNATQVGTGWSAATGWSEYNKSTGASVFLTLANWAYRFKLRTA
jgi:hypothetical protein